MMRAAQELVAKTSAGLVLTVGFELVASVAMRPEGEDAPALGV